MKERKVTQKKLAQAINVHESTLGRFLNGTTEKLSEENAAHDVNVLERIVDQVTDIPLLGSAIYSRWRYFNHWAYKFWSPRILHGSLQP